MEAAEILQVLDRVPTFTCMDGPVFDYWSVINLIEAI